MIITNEEIIRILNKEVLDDIDVLQLITNYIWEKKKYHIEKINRPDNQVRLLLMQNAQIVVVDYYTKKLINNES